MRKIDKSLSLSLPFCAMATTLLIANVWWARPVAAERPHSSRPAGKPAQPSSPPEPSPDATLKKPRLDTPETRAKMLSDLYAHLATAEDETRASMASEAIERLWANSGSPTVSLLLERAAKAMVEKKNEMALKFLDAVVDLAPDFVEGWSRRAYLYYTQSDFERAMGDLRRVLALDPNHYRALEGVAQIFKERGNKKAALKAYEQLLKVHPFANGAKDAVRELRIEVEGQEI